MNFTPPERLEPSQIVAEIGSLYGELQTRLSRIQGLSQSLYHRVRRAAPDDNTAIYLRFASTWQRFAGMASQGGKRASAVARLLRGVAEPSDEAVQERIEKLIVPRVAKPSPVESLIEMYSEESVTTEDVIESVVYGAGSDDGE